MKRVLTEIKEGLIKSPLTEGRGLKPDHTHDLTLEDYVAPHGGAWIETQKRSFPLCCPPRRPSRRGVD